FAYARTRHDAHPQPSAVYTLVRTTHASDLSPGQDPEIQHRFTYSDGFGRVVQEKSQAPPAGGDRRWIGSGWTIFNNKGNPARRYEPFFTGTQDFEFARRGGVSSIVFYDPLERVAGVLHPNHTYERRDFDPWRKESWDPNDTVLLNPGTDPTLGSFFQRLLP